jgi:C-terminal processing protease CtpA/Prc
MKIELKSILVLTLLALTAQFSPLGGAHPSAAQSAPDLEPALISVDEGGPVVLTGELDYTNPFFTYGVAEPLIILEDQAGFIDRDKGYLLPPASQTLGQITSDFYESPFSYSLALPIEPQGALRDVDHDGVVESGVMVFAVAYWTNKFGDPFLEQRDLMGGGWSTAYASTRVSDDTTTRREVIGGKLLVYAPVASQGFPSNFGPDGLLFTADDPLVSVPVGYTVVDLDTTPFTFDRSQHPVIDLIEPSGAALTDFAALGYSAALDALVAKLRKEYAFTEYKHIDWDALLAEFGPRMAAAEQSRNSSAYLRALYDFANAIPDGHVQGPFLASEVMQSTGGGLGLAIHETDDGRVFVTFLLEGGPAAAAGIEERAEILAVNGQPVGDYLDGVVVWSGPFSTEHTHRLEQMRYALRAPVGSRVEITYRNPNAADAATAVLRATSEQESLHAFGLDSDATGFELPVEFEILDSGYGYVHVYNFLDNERLTVQLWERLMQMLNREDVPGLIIDLRRNGGGNGFLADQMAAYFFDEELELGNTGRYDPALDDFYFDPRTVDRFYLPAEELRYDGAVVVLVGPRCTSAGEFFAYDITLQDRAVVVGHYPTAGLGGSVEQVLMPGDELFQFTAGRAVDMNGNIHIEGKGVVPDIRVPVTEETLFADEDPVLAAAIQYLDEATP